jgi:hypothetical protein
LTHIEAEKTNKDEPLWTQAEVAKYLALHDQEGNPSGELVSLLRQRDPAFPKPVKLGGNSGYRSARNRFEPEEIRAYRRNLRRAGELPPVNKDGTPAKKRGRKPRAGGAR